MKYVPRMLSQQLNFSAYAQHILNVYFEMVVISLYAEHAHKLVTLRLSMRKNWLIVGWACKKIGYSLAEYTLKSFCRTHTFSEFFFASPCHPFICPLLPSLSYVLFPLSHVSALYLPSLSLSLVLCLRSLSPNFCPCFTACSLSPVLCTLSITCPSVPFLWLYFPVPVLCSSVSRPLFLHLLSSVPCPSYLRESELFFKIYMHLLDGWLRATFPLSPPSQLCTLSPILCPLSQSWA